MRRLAWILMISAVLVLAPRLAVLFSQADEADLDAGAMAVFDRLAAVATALVLTLGQALLAHWMATTARHRIKLLILWCCAVATTGYLGAVAVTIRVTGDGLGDVLDPDHLVDYGRFLVLGLVATIAAEVVAAGAAIVYAGSLQVDEELATSRDELVELASRLARAEAEARRLAEENLALRARLQASQAPSTSDLDRRSTTDTTGAELVELVERHCRNGCGWTSKRLPEPNATRSEALHASRYCPRRSK